MEHSIKIAVIGGTGKAGKYLVNQLLNQGYKIKLVVRNLDHFQIQSPLIEVIQGSVSDYGVVYQLVEDCQVVISVLGLGQPNSEISIFSQSTKNVLSAMKAWNVRRYIVITGLNVDTPFDQKSPKTKFATDWMKTNYPLTTSDKQLEYNMLTNSDLDWTLVRLPLIEQTEEKRGVIVSVEDCLGDKISATDLAIFLIEQLTDRTYVRKAPFLANG